MIMRKTVFLLLVIAAGLLLTACGKENDPIGEGEEFAENLLLYKRSGRILKTYDVSMRLDLPYPFKHYVLRMDNGDNLYVWKGKLDYELRPGDYIKYSVYKAVPNEVYSINDVVLSRGEEEPRPASRGLITSDLIETEITDMFMMKVRYSIPFVGIDSWFIKTAEGRLIYIKDMDLKIRPRIGDRIKYTTFTLFPNEIVDLYIIR